MKVESFFFKQNRTNGDLYIQVWKRGGVRSEYVGSIGNAEKCAKILVRLKYLEAQTKKYKEIETKIKEGVEV